MDNIFQSFNYFNEGVHDLIEHVKYEKSRDIFFLNGIATNKGISDTEVKFILFFNEIYKPNATKAKLYIYNSTIVSLYGYLENFLEGITKEFIKKLNESLVSYSQVPEKIREIHIEVSINLLSKIKKDRTIDNLQKNIDIKNIINNMSNCVNEQGDFKLNEDAYALHTANFRYENIQELFSRVGIEDLFGGVLRNEELAEALRANNSVDSDVELSILKRWLSQELDDLAQRRNEVAHGNITSDIESMDIFIERANLILKLAKAINDIVWQRYLSILIDVSPSSLVLSNIDKAFPKRAALGFSTTTHEVKGHKNNISIGDLVRCGRGVIKRCGVIKTLFHNNIPVENIPLPTKSDFSIGVDFTVKGNLAGSELLIAAQAPLRA